MRTVITIDPSGTIDPVTNTEQFVMKVEKHGANIPGMTHVRPLQLAPFPAWQSTQGVLARGRVLRDALRLHAGVAGVLTSLETTAVGTLVPLYVKLSEGDAELITWETLCTSKDKFVALDKRWPIGRITDPATTTERLHPVFQTPVRVMAFISAFGINGQVTEWNELRDTIDDARNNGLDVEAHIVVGDPAIYAVVQQDIANGRPWVSVDPMPDNSNRLIALIRKSQPNILHFFCHGSANSAAQALELATAADLLDANATGGSVTVSADDLVGLGDDLTNPWLLVLNCCEGAQASHDFLSLAHRAVSAAFPAALAMLEPVNATDAHEFTRATYGVLFKELRKVDLYLQQATSMRFEWAVVTHDARDAINALHHQQADTQREWALPALYVRGVDPMEFRAPPPGGSGSLAKNKAAVETVATWLRSVRDSLSEPRRLDAMKKALTTAGVPMELWPTVDGDING